MHPSGIIAHTPQSIFLQDVELNPSVSAMIVWGAGSGLHGSAFFHLNSWKVIFTSISVPVDRPVERTSIGTMAPVPIFAIVRWRARPVNTWRRICMEGLVPKGLLSNCKPAV